MNIVMLGQKYIPSRIGGIEIVVQELAVRMVKRHHMVTCINRADKNNNYSAPTYEGVRLKCVPTMPFSGASAFTSSFGATILAALGNYDIIHFHAEGICGFLPFTKLLGKRCIVTIHGLDYERDKWGYFAKMYIYLCEKLVVKYADEIIVLSENLQSYFKKKYGRDCFYIPNGAKKYQRKEVNIINERYGLHSQDYILFLGRIVPEKGIQHLIQSYKKANTGKKLVIAGSHIDMPKFFKEMKNLAASDNRIIFTDFVEGPVFEELMSNAYFYVLPSNIEGMPLSLLEAMGYGNCCLVSDIPENLQVIEDYGFSFKHTDPEDLLRMIHYLIQHPEEVARVKDYASDFVCSKYNWDDIVEKTLQVYRGDSV